MLFAPKEKGESLMEYVLIFVLIVGGAMIIILLIGSQRVEGIFDRLRAALSGG
jgi:hypothetical protein